MLDDCLKAVFDSSRTYGLFTSYFSEEFYRHAASFYKNNVFGRDRYAYAVCGVTRVLEDVEISQRNHPPYRDMQRFLEQDFCNVPGDNEDAQIIDKFKSYFTARIQFQLWQKIADGSLKILSISDDNAKVSCPEWYKKSGFGYVIQSYSGKLEIVFKTLVSGQIRLNLLGIDVRDSENKHIPYWIDYTALTVNGETIFDTLTPAWHNKPYRHIIDVNAGEEIKLQVEWLPHRSDT